MEMDSMGNSSWVVAMACSLLNCLQAGTFFMTPTTIMPLIVKDFGTSIAAAAVPIAIGKLSYVLMLIPGGVLVDSFGPRLCVILAFFGLAITTTVYGYFITHFWQITVMQIILSAFSSTSGVPVYAVVITSWFTENIGLAMGIVLSGFSFAGTIIPAILAPIASAYGWRTAMLSMSGMLWFIGIPLAFRFLKEKKTNTNINEDALEDKSEFSEVVTQNSMLDLTQESKAFSLDSELVYLFALFSVAYFLLQYMTGCFAENILYFLHIDEGIDISFASLFFSALNLAAFCAKLSSGILGDRFDRFRTAILLSMLTTIGISILFLHSDFPKLTHSIPGIFCFALLFGFGYGSTFNALYSLAPTIFGIASLGKIQSTLFAVGLGGNATGAVLTGVLRTYFGNYRIAFAVAWTFSVMNTLVLSAVSMSSVAKKLREEAAIDDLRGESTESFLQNYSEDFVSAPSFDNVHTAHALYWNRRRNLTMNTFAAMRRERSLHNMHNNPLLPGYGNPEGKHPSTFFDIIQSGFIGNTMEFTGFERDPKPPYHGFPTSRSVVGLSPNVLHREFSGSNMYYHNRDLTTGLLNRDQH